MIRGMMCSHCEKRVREALLAVSGVSDVSVSSKSGKAEILGAENLNKDALKTAVEAAGYKVIKIKE